MSDTHNYIQCMLATQANHIIHDGKLVRGCIARIKSYQSSAVKGKKYVLPVSPTPFYSQPPASWSS